MATKPESTDRSVAPVAPAIATMILLAAGIAAVVMNMMGKVSGFYSRFTEWIFTAFGGLGALCILTAVAIALWETRLENLARRGERLPRFDRDSWGRGYVLVACGLLSLLFIYGAVFVGQFMLEQADRQDRTTALLRLQTMEIRRLQERIPPPSALRAASSKTR